MRCGVPIIALLCGSALCGPVAAAPNATAVPDFSGLWGRKSFDFEAQLRTVLR
jgi:hypothetical protein